MTGDQEGRRIRVLAADDQRVVREGLAMLLSLLPDVEVVGTAADGEEAVRLATAAQPDVVLMDLRMPHLDGAAATRLLRERCPDVRVIVLTTYADDRSVIDALRAGARGYLTKDAGAEEIRRALHDVTSGRAVIDPAVQGHLVDAIAAPGDAPTAPAAPTVPAAPTASAGPGALTSPATDPIPDPQVLAANLSLTPREGEVLALIAEGLSNLEIAGRLVVSEATVKKPRQPPAGQDRGTGSGLGRQRRLPARSHPARPGRLTVPGYLGPVGGEVCQRTLWCSSRAAFTIHRLLCFRRQQCEVAAKVIVTYS
jgi:DNA-binding NarL/FixJ family response regulator